MANMTPNDRIVLARWLRCGATLVEIDNLPAYGLVGNLRFTEAAPRAFRLIWMWYQPRYAGEAGLRHDVAYAALGKVNYHRRIERCRRIAARLMK